ncbi:MAG: hypothetical protein PHE33_01370 [Bacteroidales bacterium]|nr:hypothetical protein [Bacteroidales bacterium]
MQQNNYYGITGFKDSGLKENTKSVLSKLLFLYPRIETFRVKDVPKIHNTEASAWLYINLLKKGIKKYDAPYISDRILLLLKYWINTNGFITMTEVLEVRDYCGLTTSEYLERLCDILPEIDFKEKNKCLNFLNYYSKFIEEKHINYVLDAYCQTELAEASDCQK